MEDVDEVAMPIWHGHDPLQQLMNLLLPLPTKYRDVLRSRCIQSDSSSLSGYTQHVVILQRLTSH
jgi:hypothetical protein